MPLKLLNKNLSKIATKNLNKNLKYNAKFFTHNALPKSNNFTEDFEKNFIETTYFQKAFLAVGSSAISIFDITRGDMIACFGEILGDSSANYMIEKMKNSTEGSRILKEKPRINSSTIDFKKLSELPKGTLGREYFEFLNKNKVTPDSRNPVQFVGNLEYAYAIQRYREVHDLVHTIHGMPTNMLGEVTVKWIEAFQTKLPMCIYGAIFGAARLKPKQRIKYNKYYLPWACQTGPNEKFFMNVYFEERWEQSMDDLHKELNIKPLVIDSN